MRQFHKVTEWALGLVLAVGFVGCTPTYPKCENDDHCKEKGEFCVQGMCRECAVDANCKDGFVCDANKCVPRPACASDADCKNGGKCQGGRCASPSVSKGCSAKSDCGQGEDCVAGKCAAAVSSASESCEFEPVRFDFNEVRLSSEAQDRLSKLVDCIKKQKLKVTLEGHADERGTEEYNLQLSNRRAASVKRYLVDLGAAGTDLDTLGYGENRPVDPSSTEAAWAKNRRVELIKKN